MNKTIKNLESQYQNELNKNKELNEIKNNLNSQYQTELNKNKELNIKIQSLNIKLNSEIKNKESFIEKNKDLTNEINNLKQKCVELENKIDNNKNINLNHNNDSLVELYRRIDEYKEKLSVYPFELLKNEKMLSVIIHSNDESLLCSIICKNTEKFNRIEERFYNEYPEYYERDNYFVFNGTIINKFQTLEENKIKNNNIIILNKKND